MSAAISQYLDRIAELCRKFRVVRLELFGSATRDDFDPATSDFDFLVTFEDLGWQGSFDRYMGLKFGLEDLLGRPVDLVEPAAITNPYFRASALRNPELVYAA